MDYSKEKMVFQCNDVILLRGVQYECTIWTLIVPWLGWSPYFELRLVSPYTTIVCVILKMLIHAKRTMSLYCNKCKYWQEDHQHTNENSLDACAHCISTFIFDSFIMYLFNFLTPKIIKIFKELLWGKVRVRMWFFQAKN